MCSQFLLGNPFFLQHRGAPWRYGTTRSLCGELSLWSGAHWGDESSHWASWNCAWKFENLPCFATHLGQPPIVWLFAPNGRSCLLFFVFVWYFLFMFPLCGHSTLWDTSARHLRLLGFLTSGWHNSCMILSTGSEPRMGGWKTLAERRGLCFSVGATNVARSRFAMEIKLKH